MSGLDFDAVRMRQMRARGQTPWQQDTPESTTDAPHPFPRQCPYEGCQIVVASQDDLNAHAGEEH